MNRPTTLIAICLTLPLLTCNVAAAPVAQTQAPQETTPSTQEMVKQAKELGSAAWEKTRQHTAQVGSTIQKRSKEYYKAAKESASEAAEAVAEKSKSYYKTAKEKSEEYLEKASETAADLTEAAKESAGEYYESGKEILQPTGDRANNTI